VNSPVRLLWLSALTCNGNAHALLNYPDLEHWQHRFEWLYHPLLPSRFSLGELLAQQPECDILILEGTLDSNFSKAGKDLTEWIEIFAPAARAVVTVGSCATFGGIFLEGGEGRSGLHFRRGERRDAYDALWEKSISLPGCPVQPEILASTLEMLAQETPLDLDVYRRPLLFYGTTVHNGCTRNEYFEYKIDEHRFGEMEGCMFYEHGCQGTYTHGSCNRILWNNVNSKTRIGQPCMGCTEPDFPTTGLWETRKHMGIPARLPAGIPKRAYLSLAGVAKAFHIERFRRPILDPVERYDPMKEQE